MTIDSNTTPYIKPHSIGQSLFLHLIPGVLIIVFFIFAVPVVKMFDFPVPFALVLAILFVLIPFELGVLFYEGKKLNGRFSLRGIVVFRERIQLRQYFIFVPILLLWLIICFSLFTSLDNFFIKKLFAWLPEYFIPTNWLANVNKYPLNNRIIAAGLFFVANALVGPVVEEMYFRGYLLPRLSRIKGWAPFVHTILFSIYHLFSPWQQLSRIIGLFPMVYIVSKKKNIYLGMITHCILNSLSTVSMMILIFK